MAIEVITLKDAFDNIAKENLTTEELKNIEKIYSHRKNPYDYIMFNIDNFYNIAPTLTRKEFYKIFKELVKGNIYFYPLTYENYVIFFNYTTKEGYII